MSFEASWVCGFSENGIHFINNTTLIYLSGQYVCFRNIDRKDTKYMILPSYAVTKLAVHPSENIFALIESDKLDPKIFIYNYPDLENIGFITHFTQLEVLHAKFSDSNYLYLVSGLPDYTLTVWDYTTSTKVCSVELNCDEISCLSISPIQWRNVAVLCGTKLKMFHIENCGNDHFTIKPTLLSLPNVNMKLGETKSARIEDSRRSKSRAQTRAVSTAFELPPSVIAGVSNEYYEEFLEDQDTAVRCHGECIAWNEMNDLFIGCSNGRIVKLEVKDMRFLMITNYDESGAIETSTYGEHFPKTDSFISVGRMSGGTNSRFTLSPRSTSWHSARVHTHAPYVHPTITHMCYAREGLYFANSDGILSLLQRQNNKLKHVEPVHSMGEGGTVSSLVFNPDYSALCICSYVLGKVDILTSDDNNICGFVKDEVYIEGQRESYSESIEVGFIDMGGHGLFVGCCQLANRDYIATVKSDGLVQFWKSSNGDPVNKINTDGNAVSIVSSPLWNIVVVGLESGCIEVLDCRDVTKCHSVFRQKLHTSPVTKLEFDRKSQLLVTASNDGRVCVLSGLVSENFQVIGITKFTGKLIDLCVFNNPTADEMAQVAVAYRDTVDAPGANKVIYFEISASIMNDPSSHYESIDGTFNEESIRKMWLNVEKPIYGCVMGVQPPDQRSPLLYVIDYVSRVPVQLQIPSEVPKKVGNKASYMSALETYDAMKLDDAEVTLQSACNGKLIMSYASDGFVRILNLKDPSKPIMIPSHQITTNGVACAIFDYAKPIIFSCGADGSIIKHDLDLPDNIAKEIEMSYNEMRDIYHSKIKIQNAELQSLLELRKQKNLEDRQSKGGEADEKQADTAKKPMTWSEQRVIDHQAEEDQVYNQEISAIKKGLEQMRNEITQMVAENETRGELEKMDRQEFELDVATKNSILEQINLDVQHVRDEIELKNLACLFRHDVIKRDCWDALHVKGRSLCSFSLSGVVVNNFPLHERSEKFLAVIKKIVKRRMIEMKDAVDRKVHTDFLTKSSTELDDVEEDTLEEEGEKEVSDLTVHDLKDYENFMKVASNYKYLYPQLELETREQKINQILLIKDIVYEMKTSFNKEFADLYDKKEQEMTRIREKQNRIKKILSELGLNEAQVEEVDWRGEERPELLLEVKDEEVSVARYLSDEELAKLEAARKAEEERSRLARLDNWRERGLDDMMGGVLEIRREDELKKEVPTPLFIQQGTPKEEWTDEERRIYAEYQTKCAELEEEREKYRKQLEGEWRKLHGIIEDAKSGYDELLIGLFNRQISVMMSVLQEEVKILRLQASLVQDEMLEGRRLELCDLKDASLIAQGHIREEINTVKEVIFKKTDKNDQLVMEERLMDKAFKKEFSDVHGHVFEQIAKLYKKRGKAARINAEKSCLGSYQNSPYRDRPTTAKKRKMVKEANLIALQELDKIDQTDIVFDSIPGLWERMCKARRKRLEKEILVKISGEDLQNMHKFLEKRQEEDHKLERELMDIDELEVNLFDMQQHIRLAKEVQLVLKQGQVEVEPREIGLVRDLTDCILVNRVVIESLNAEIKELGLEKVNHMTKAKDNRKRFVHMEWELKRMLMEYEDLVRKMREIQCFKITKEIQKYLATNDYDGLINAEIQKMEQTIAKLIEHQKRKIKKKESRFDKIKSQNLSKIQNENQLLNNELIEFNVQVNERRIISEGFPSDTVAKHSSEMRYQKILQRQHLIDLAKSQAREVAVLRSEVERLRMRTFPALVQPK